jgi:ectoine hydroxylase-related dioxygenase (phytanoyl-CoA dioxygenase family)
MPPLSPADRDDFARSGILFPIPVLGPAEIAAARRVAEAVRALPPDIRKPLLRSKTHLVSRTLWDMLFHPAILDAVEGLVGPDMFVWGANFFAKDAGSPDYVSWHQDAQYWGLEPDDIVTAWVALTDSSRDNGCMRVVAGSHRTPLPHVDTFAADNMLSRGQEIAVRVEDHQATEVVLRPGEMSLHHVRIAHGSEPNRSDRPRIGFVIRYVGGHVRPAGGRRDGAVRVRGTDRGHFVPETPPQGELHPDDLARHAASR